MKFSPTQQPSRRRGPSCTPRALRQSILRALAPDHDALLRSVAGLARAGDAQAQVAAAVLLAAALFEPGAGSVAPAE